jgi:hypothetical protein
MNAASSSFGPRAATIVGPRVVAVGFLISPTGLTNLTREAGTGQRSARRSR